MAEWLSRQSHVFLCWLRSGQVKEKGKEERMLQKYSYILPISIYLSFTSPVSALFLQSSANIMQRPQIMRRARLHIFHWHSFVDERSISQTVTCHKRHLDIPQFLYCTGLYCIVRKLQATVKPDRAYKFFHLKRCFIHTFKQVIKPSLLDFEYLIPLVKNEQFFAKLQKKKISVMKWFDKN